MSVPRTATAPITAAHRFAASPRLDGDPERDMIGNAADAGREGIR